MNDAECRRLTRPVFVLSCLFRPPTYPRPLLCSAPVPSTRGGGGGAGGGTNPATVHAFRRFDADWAKTSGGRNLEALFRPPLEIMFTGTFEEVR